MPAGIPVTIKMYKEHCGGGLSGALTYDFVTDEGGEGGLVKQGLGTWSITVNNEEDRLLADFYVNNSPTVVGSEVLPVGHAPLTSTGVNITFGIELALLEEDRPEVTTWTWLWVHR